jgi:pentatricopeptide repeat protein
VVSVSAGINSEWSRQGNVKDIESWWHQLDMSGFTDIKPARIHELRLVGYCEAGLYDDVLRIRDEMHASGLSIRAIGWFCVSCFALYHRSLRHAPLYRRYETMNE